MTSRRFSEAELRAEWARECVLAGLGGEHRAGGRAAVLARFLLTPGIESAG